VYAIPVANAHRGHERQLPAYHRPAASRSRSMHRAPRRARPPARTTAGKRWSWACSTSRRTRSSAAWPSVTAPRPPRAHLDTWSESGGAWWVTLATESMRPSPRSTEHVGAVRPPRGDSKKAGSPATSARLGDRRGTTMNARPSTVTKNVRRRPGSSAPTEWQPVADEPTIAQCEPAGSHERRMSTPPANGQRDEAGTSAIRRRCPRHGWSGSQIGAHVTDLGSAGPGRRRSGRGAVGAGSCGLVAWWLVVPVWAACPDDQPHRSRGAARNGERAPR